MSASNPGLPVYVIDGATFDDFGGFSREFSKLLDGWQWNGNLDAFNDIMRGGFGTPDGGWVFRWLNSDRSRRVLGHEAAVQRLEAILPKIHPTNRDKFERRLAAARRSEGPTLFDQIVEIIREHGPGGGEAEDGVVLDLA
ncbi:MAG: barstar family protein [Micromonosporaceae bacterium]